MCGTHFIAFLLMAACFTLLYVVFIYPPSRTVMSNEEFPLLNLWMKRRTLVTFSTPFVKMLYFLQTDESGGVRFGLWGWCLLDGSFCSPKAYVPPQMRAFLDCLHLIA